MKNQYFCVQDSLEFIIFLIIFGINDLIFVDVRFGIDSGWVLGPFWLHFGFFWDLEINIKSVLEIKLRQQTSQDHPKRSKDRSKRPPDRLKRPPRPSQQTPRGAQEASKTLPDGLKRHPRRANNTSGCPSPQKASLTKLFNQLANKLSQLIS